MSGLSNFEAKNYGQAIEAFNNAIKEATARGGQVAVHYNNRGLAQFHLGQNAKALDDFSKALQLDDRDPNIYYNRGNVLIGMNRFEEAREDLDAAIRIQPSRPKYYHAKGLSFEAQAIVMEEALISSSPDTKLDEEGYPIKI